MPYMCIVRSIVICLPLPEFLTCPTAAAWADSPTRVFSVRSVGVKFAFYACQLQWGNCSVGDVGVVTFCLL